MHSLSVMGYVDGKRKCPYCNVPMFSDDALETFDHFIGKDRIKVKAFVQKGHCPRCGKKWEHDDARILRNNAFKNAIDAYWNEKLQNLTSQGMITDMKLISRKLLEDDRQAAAEFGRWLAGCAWID